MPRTAGLFGKKQLAEISGNVTGIVVTPVTASAEVPATTAAPAAIEPVAAVVTAPAAAVPAKQS